MNFAVFSLSVVEALVRAGARDQQLKRGRTSSSPLQPLKWSKCFNRNTVDDVWYNRIGNKPQEYQKQQCCKLEVCKGKTICEKYNFHLCLSNQRFIFLFFIRWFILKLAQHNDGHGYNRMLWTRVHRAKAKHSDANVRCTGCTQGVAETAKHVIFECAGPKHKWRAVGTWRWRCVYGTPTRTKPKPSSKPWEGEHRSKTLEQRNEVWGACRRRSKWRKSRKIIRVTRSRALVVEIPQYNTIQ